MKRTTIQILTVYYILFFGLFIGNNFAEKIDTPEVLSVPPVIIKIAVASPSTKTIIIPERQSVSRSVPILTKEEKINRYTKEICKSYNIKPALVESIIFYESAYQIEASNGNCVGLMQVSTYWHASRAKQLGITDFYEPYSNILVGVDYLSELFRTYKDPALVLMVYNMGQAKAVPLYKKGIISNYARLILIRSEEVK